MNLLGWLVLAALVVVLSVAGSGQAYAQQYPQVATLQPFSPQTNYMSLAGYLRWQVFVEHGTWLTHSEAVAILHGQQHGRLVAAHPS